jgi:hypothetical protein
MGCNFAIWQFTSFGATNIYTCRMCKQTNFSLNWESCVCVLRIRTTHKPQLLNVLMSGTTRVPDTDSFLYASQKQLVQNSFELSCTCVSTSYLPVSRKWKQIPVSIFNLDLSATCLHTRCSLLQCFHDAAADTDKNITPLCGRSAPGS